MSTNPVLDPPSQSAAAGGADDSDDSVAGFIDRTIAEYECAAATPEGPSDSVLLQPLSVLPPADPVLVESPASVLEAVHLMREQHAGCVLVVRAGKLQGIFTDRDVVTRVVADGVDPSRTPLRRVMTASPQTLRPTDSIAFALNLMNLGGYRHIPLVDKAGAPVGTVSMKDIVGYLVGFFPKSVLNLPPAPRADVVREREGA